MYPKMRREKIKKGDRHPNRLFCLGKKEDPNFIEWREVTERNILQNKGDTEITRKFFKKYEKYFDEEEGYISVYDVGIYRKLITSEIEKEEKKNLKNVVFLPI